MAHVSSSSGSPVLVTVKLAGSNDQKVPLYTSSTGQLPVLSIQNFFGLQFVKLVTGPAALTYDLTGFSNCTVPTYQPGDTVIIEGPFSSGNVVHKLDKLQDDVTTLKTGKFMKKHSSSACQVEFNSLLLRLCQVFSGDSDKGRFAGRSADSSGSTAACKAWERKALP